MNEQLFISELLGVGLITDHQSMAIKRYLENRPSQEKIISIEDRKQAVRNIIASYFGLSWKNISSKSRKQEYVDARHIYFYSCCEYLKIPLKSTGIELGQDHTSVIHGRDKIRDRIYISDAETLHALAIVKKELNILNETT